MEAFTELAIPAALSASLTRMEYNKPTPIQAKAIPIALEGKDILASAQTGTGKTAAFSIPIVAKLMESPRGAALIMLPTRELAVQVVDVIRKMLGANNPIKSALLIGGEAMHPQLRQLQARPRIIVGTPGRINDHLERGSLKLHDAGILVLDETDRMLDMGFGIQIDRILKFMPKQRQTLMFSATLPKNIMQMAEKYLVAPQRIEVGSNNTPVQNIKQEIINTSVEDKYNELIKQLGARSGSIIIFVKTKRGAEKLSIKLNREGHSADTIHGDLPQKKRDRVIKAFREKEHRVMVATDIAARGLDIPHIEHVINYDLPQCPEDYIHRIGRTARAGAQGSALCLVSPEDRGKMNAINRLINPGAKPEKSEGGERDYAKKRSFRGGYAGKGGRPGGNRDRDSRGGEGRGGDNRTGGDSRSADSRSGESRGGDRDNRGGKPGGKFGGKPAGAGNGGPRKFGKKPGGARKFGGGGNTTGQKQNAA